MKPVENAVIESQLSWRYATKQFDPRRRIAARDWATLEKALVLSPSSYGLQPWRFIVVGDPAVREQLRAASWNQPQITEASHLVVFCARKDPDSEFVDRYMERMADVRGMAVADLNALRQRIVGHVTREGFDATAWASRQTYIALGMFLATAAMLGIDACPMEGIDPAKYDKILGLGKLGAVALCVATAGYRAVDDRNAALPKVRFLDRDVIHRV